MDNYYTPKLEEFIQGFKYQVLSIRKGDVIYTIFGSSSNIKKEFRADKDYWYDTEVWWDREPKFITKEFPNGVKISYMEPQWDLKPFYDVETYLNNGMIRAKRYE